MRTFPPPPPMPPRCRRSVAVRAQAQTPHAVVRGRPVHAGHARARRVGCARREDAAHEEHVGPHEGDEQVDEEEVAYERGEDDLVRVRVRIRVRVRVRVRVRR